MLREILMENYCDYYLDNDEVGTTNIKARFNVNRHYVYQPCNGGDLSPEENGVLIDKEVLENTKKRDRVPNLPAACDCLCAYPSVAPNNNLTVKPKVTINVPATAKDGDMVTFSVTTQGGTPTAYLWSFESPNGAGNSPQVNFTASTSGTTNAKAHWFANPNSDCATSPPDPSASHPYYNSRYKIKIKVTFQDGREITKEKDFTVNAWWSPAGSVAPATNSGGIQTGFDNTRMLFVVINSGTMARTTYPAVISIPTASQFYNKTLRHEEKHELQWQSGLFKDIWAVSRFMAVVSNFTATTSAGLTQQINQAFVTWDAQQLQDYRNNFNAAEIEAYTISDLLAPQYAYQRCGRTIFQ